MGLDMWALSVAADRVGDRQTDVSVDNIEEIAYWRKFNHLHGWMKRLYIQKGGEDPSFNCNTVRLNDDDLNKLEKDLDNGLPHEAGFFFGGDEIYEEDIEKTKVFIKDARQGIRDGYAIFYDSSW